MRALAFVLTLLWSACAWAQPHGNPQLGDIWLYFGPTLGAGWGDNPTTSNLPNNTILGNVSGIAAPASALTATQATTLCNTFTSLLKGCVPASGGDAATYLNGAGGFTIPEGAGITQLTGDVTATGTGSVAATLANTAVTPGSYTTANITVDAKGRLTAAANGAGGGGTDCGTGVAGQVCNNTGGTAAAWGQSVIGPDGTGAGAGTDVSITAGTGGATGAGGILNLSSGLGGATSGDGGAINLTTGSATSGGGGFFDITTGDGTTGGGYARFFLGQGGETGVGGDFVVFAGDGGNTSGVGGQINLISGNARGDNDGGAASLTAGSAGSGTGGGGTLSLVAGSGGGTAGNGGGVLIGGGDAFAGNGNGGNIILTPGVKNGSGTPGYVYIPGRLNVGQVAIADLGEIAQKKITASGTAPGAGTAKVAWVAGTNAGTCKLISYAGTSTTPVTVIDNVGTGC